MQVVIVTFVTGHRVVSIVTLAEHWGHKVAEDTTHCGLLWLPGGRERHGTLYMLRHSPRVYCFFRVLAGVKKHVHNL